jgi:hypothetical protein
MDEKLWCRFITKREKKKNGAKIIKANQPVLAHRHIHLLYPKITILEEM